MHIHPHKYIKYMCDIVVIVVVYFLSHVHLLGDPRNCTPPGSSLHGTSQKEYWSGVPFPYPGDLPEPGIESASLALAGGYFTIEPPKSFVRISLG